MEKHELFPVKEKTIENYFCEQVVKIGGATIKIGFDSWPDRLALVCGQAYFVELKRPGKTLKKGGLQRLRKKQLENLGFLVYVINTKDQVDKFIKYLIILNNIVL